MLSDEQLLEIFASLDQQSAQDAAYIRADAEGAQVDPLGLIFARNGWRSFQRAARAIESALSQSTEQGERDAEETLRWCNHCGEGVTTFCRGKSEACPMQLKKLRAAMSPHGDGGRG